MAAVLKRLYLDWLPGMVLLGLEPLLVELPVVLRVELGAPAFVKGGGEGDEVAEPLKLDVAAVLKEGKRPKVVPLPELEHDAGVLKGFNNVLAKDWVQGP